MPLPKSNYNQEVITDSWLNEIAKLAAARSVVSVTGGAPVSLTSAQFQARILWFSGALTANQEVVLPADDGRVWLVVNATTGAFTLRLKLSASTGILIAQGMAAHVLIDSAEVRRAGAEYPYDAASGLALIASSIGPSTTQQHAVPAVASDTLALLAAAQTLANKTLTGCAGVAGAGDLDMGGGYRQTVAGFYRDSVPASLAAVAMSLHAAGAAFPTKWIAPRAGSLTGVSVKSSAARTAGTLTVQVYRNGVAVAGLTAVLDGTNTTFKATAAAKDANGFAAGDELELWISTDAAWAPTTASVRAALEVET